MVGWLVVTVDGGTFFASGNLTNILQRSVALGIVAVGQTVAILAGSLDLSVSYLISLASLVGAETMDGRESMLVPAIALTLALGAGVGLVNGLIITKLRVNAFIATLGMALVLRGYIENNYDRPTGSVPESWESFGYTRIGPIPVSVFLFAGVALVVGLALRRTRFGYHVYAVGGDEQVVGAVGPAHPPGGHRRPRDLLGVRRAHRAVPRQPARVGHPPCRHRRWLRPRVDRRRGARRHGPGRRAGRVAGTVGAVLVLAVLDNIFNQLELDPFLKQAVRGVVIIAAVAVYALRRRERPQAATGTAAA